VHPAVSLTHDTDGTPAVRWASKYKSSEEAQMRLVPGTVVFYGQTTKSFKRPMNQQRFKLMCARRDAHA
jgi:hypothetical protein